MSAFIVDKKHIDSLVTAYIDYKVRLDMTGEEINHIGQVLTNQNYKSVNYRYEEEYKAPEYRYKYTPQEPIQIIKACHCYDYQSCETDDYKSTKAYIIIRAIEGQAMRRLPGYAEALWEIY